MAVAFARLSQAIEGNAWSFIAAGFDEDGGHGEVECNGGEPGARDQEPGAKEAGY
jgi:hypothetical protein